MGGISSSPYCVHAREHPDDRGLYEHTLEQGPPGRPEAPATAEGCLGNSSPAIAGGSDLALFNLAIDSKLRGCDLVALQGEDAPTARCGTAGPSSTGGPVQFEITEQPRASI